MDNELNKDLGHDKEHGCGGNCGCNHDHDHDHEHGDCGCGEEEFEHFVVDLEDEDGNVISCPIIDAFEFEGAEYVLVQHPEEETQFLFRSNEEGELELPDEEEFEKVANYYSEVVINEEEA